MSFKDNKKQNAYRSIQQITFNNQLFSFTNKLNKIKSCIQFIIRTAEFPFWTGFCLANYIDNLFRFRKDHHKVCYLRRVNNQQWRLNSIGFANFYKIRRLKIFVINA